MKYKNGLVLGKMYPPTKGHLHLIESALKEAETVHVVVCFNSTQDISGKDRTYIIRNSFKHTKRVKIYQLCDDGKPQSDKECDTLDEFYAHWVPAVHDTVRDMDVVFTSEEYGDDFGRYLGIDHVMIDLHRKTVSISGTKVRQDPFGNWDFIPNQSKFLYAKRIALMGPESVGKTVLAEKLADHYQTEYVGEYGRQFYEENDNSAELYDFIKIAMERSKLEKEAILKCNKLMIADTEDITTYVFSKLFYPKEYKKLEPFFMNRIEKMDKHDLYVLLKPDCPGVDDGVRQHLEVREKHYDMIKEQLDEHGCNYIEVGGSWKERFEQSVDKIDSLIK
jgi:HTH-type transcriptional regulator, transcriptional repressor of NAD biosynthesis genes